MVVTGPSVHAEPVPPPEGGSNGKLNWIFDLDTQLNWTDNLFRSEEEEFETWGTVISPALQTWIQNGTNSVSVTLRAGTSPTHPATVTMPQITSPTWIFTTSSTRATH